MLTVFWIESEYKSMRKSAYAFIGGVCLTALFFSIGLWGNYILSGDPLHLVSGSDSPVKAASVLFTSLFVGLSGGHYIGGSFNDDDGHRAFALGSNTVLWFFLIGFIGFQVREGGELIEPLLYSAFLILSSGGIFALHGAGLIEDESRLDEYVGLFSSKGTALIVTVTLIIRTVTDPFLASAAIIGAIIVGLLIWNAYGDIIREYWEQIDKQIEELRTSDTEEAFLEES